MRERTALPRAVLERLPRLTLLVRTGMGNAAEAARARPAEREPARVRGRAALTSGCALRDRHAEIRHGRAMRGDQGFASHRPLGAVSRVSAELAQRIAKLMPS